MPRKVRQNLNVILVEYLLQSLSFLQMSGLTPFVPPPMPPPPSCNINFFKDAKKLTREGRDFYQQKVEFPAIVISFADFNAKMKEVVKNCWPMATFKRPSIRINGEVCLFFACFCVCVFVRLFVCLFVLLFVRLFCFP